MNFFCASPHDDHGRSVSQRYIENVDGRMAILRAKVFLAIPYLLLLGMALTRHAWSMVDTKVVLIDKVVLGGRKKGNGNEPYFWGQNLWGHRQARPFPISWIWPG